MAVAGDDRNIWWLLARQEIVSPDATLASRRLTWRNIRSLPGMRIKF